jgi:cysteinyl-tRNA synthetase
VDLKFTHHDNEMAQAEAYHDCHQWVNYFLHAGQLMIKGLKMSKLLKNFVTFRQALEEHTPRQLRLVFLMQPWDKLINYSDQTVEDAKTKGKKFKNFFGAVKSLLHGRDFVSECQGWNPADRALQAALLQAQEQVHPSLLDNFKTYEAIQTMVDLVRDADNYIAACDTPKALLVKKIAMYITKMLRVFGTTECSDEIGFGDSNTTGGGGGGGGSKEAIVGPFVDALVDFRDQVRMAAKQKNSGPSDLLPQCDDVRDTALARLGVRVEDSAAASVSKLDDPEVMMKEIQEKRANAAAAVVQKQKRKAKKLEADLAKAHLSKVPKSEMFKTGSHADKWGSHDESGMPLTTKEGDSLTKSQKKSLAEAVKNQEKAYEKLVALAGEEGVEAYLTALAADLEALKLQMDGM